MDQDAAIEYGAFHAVGHWFADFVSPILDSFVNPNVGPALALSILAVGIAIAVLFSARVAQVGFRLLRLERVLKGIPDAASFGQRFGEVAPVFESEPLTKHGWLELRDSFVWPPRDGDPISNTVRPSRYLNRSEAGLQFRRIQSMPNLFVGIGLLFTFIGLVAALKAANSGIASGDVAATTASLGKLLGAATAKFYTSIAGLACSIVLGFVIRHGIARIDHHFATLATLLEGRLVAVTPESLASHLLEEAKVQTEQLKGLNTDIAIAIGNQLREALDEALPKHLAAVASPLAERVTEMMNLVSSQSRDGVGEMIKAFGERLEGATQDRMGDLAVTLERLTATLDRTAQRMGQGGNDLGQALNSAAGQLAATVEAVRETVAAMAERMRTEGNAGQELLQQQIERIDQAMSLMASRLVAAVEDGAARAREGAGEATASLIVRVSEAAERLGAVAGGFETAIGQASERAQAAIHAMAEGTANEFRAAGEEGSNELRGAIEAMATLVERLSAELANTTQGLRELENRMAAHARAIGEAEGGTKAVVGALGETATHIRTAGSEASGGLRAATQPLIAIGDRLAQSTEATRRASEGLERLFTSTAEQAKRQAEAAEKALDQLEVVWERHVRRFDVVDDQLGKALEEIGLKLRENLGHLARFSAEIDSHTGKAIGSFAGAIEDLEDISREISEGIKAINGRGPHQ